MSQPALKIKLRLNGPSVSVKSDNSSPSSSSNTSATSSPAQSSVKLVNESDHVVPASPAKKQKLNRRSKKPQSNATTPAATEPATPSSITAGDDDASVPDDAGTPASSTAAPTPTATPATPAAATPSSRPRGGHHHTSHHATTSRKDILKNKDTKVRKWTKAPMTFYTLEGNPIQLGSWNSEEEMTLNKRNTEPTTLADIDALYSASGVEKDFRPYLCTQPGCSKSFTTYDQLQTHETNMHGTKKLICGINGCHKSFVTPGQLTKHRKMVHFRAARKAKMEAAAAAAAAAEESANADDTSSRTGTTTNNDAVTTTETPPPTATNGSSDALDVVNSEDMTT